MRNSILQLRGLLEYFKGWAEPEGKYGHPAPATFFNLMEPGEANLDIHNGSANGNPFEATTAIIGDYRVWVYISRATPGGGRAAKEGDR